MRLKPNEIEERSMQIIEKRIPKGIYTEKELLLVKKIIHTTADFSLRKNIVFKESAIDLAVKNLREGKDIVTDVFMVSAGISPALLNGYKGKVHCFVRDKEVEEMSKSLEITRAEAGMRYAVQNLNNIGIFAIGNSPTAIFELLRLNKEGKLPKDVVVLGFCVGMVGAKEAKDELLKSDLPAILLKGNRGGSPICATVINGLFKILKSQGEQA